MVPVRPVVVVGVAVVSGDVLNGGAWGCPAGTAGGEEQRWGVDWGEGVRMWMGEVRWELQ